jgi:hypothetical protein
MEALIRLADWTSPLVLALGVRFAAWLHPYNLIVTNVPGPPLPLYLLGAQMLEGYPLVPLFDNQALAVAVFSYNGKLCWGVNADADRVPDLHLFMDALQASFEALRRAAAPRTRPKRRAGGTVGKLAGLMTKANKQARAATEPTLNSVGTLLEQRIAAEARLGGDLPSGGARP